MQYETNGLTLTYRAAGEYRGECNSRRFMISNHARVGMYLSECGGKPWYVFGLSVDGERAYRWGNFRTLRDALHGVHCVSARLNELGMANRQRVDFDNQGA